MNSICIIGQGNVATHLCVAFAGNVNELIQTNSRTLEDLPLDCDLYIIAVSDNAIQSIASHLPKLSGVVAHTSGSVSIDALQSIKGAKGVFYPLMTFSRDADIDYRQIPIFIEGDDAETQETLRKAASLFTDKITAMDSAKRTKMHIASIFACNFANALWQTAYEMMEAENVPFKYLLPLIDATAEKLHHLSPFQAQTGPAKRSDTEVINKHIEMLGENTYKGNLYKELTQLIINQSNGNVVN